MPLFIVILNLYVTLNNRKPYRSFLAGSRDTIVWRLLGYKTYLDTKPV